MPFLGSLNSIKKMEVKVLCQGSAGFIPGAFFASAPATSHLNVVVRSSFLYWGGSKWLVNSPRVSSSDDSPVDNSSRFYPCCPMRGHIWTAFLNPIDRPPISAFFPTTPLSLFFHPKPFPLFLFLYFFIPLLLPLPIRFTAASYPYASSHQW